jgi:hypothetical protein
MTRVGRLIVVRHGAQQPKFHCLIPGCGAKFTEEEARAYQAHVARCSTENEDRLRGASMRTVAPGLFDPTIAGDPERESWVRAHRRGIIDGSVRM